MKIISFVVAVAITAAAHAADRPNVLFITSDDLNNSLGCYGAPVKTPNLDRLAARGVRFDRAYCQYPLCGPSRASFMTGLRPNTTGVITNGVTVRHKHQDIVTLPQLLRENGYFTARSGKIYHLGIPGEVGKPGPDDPQSWDHTYNPPGAEFNTPGDESDPTPGRGQGFRRVMGKGEGVEQADYQAADEAIRLLREHQEKRAGKPFFLAVGFIRPHVPVIAPKRYFDLYDVSAIKLPQVPPNDRDDIPAAAFQDAKRNWDMTEQAQRESIQAYYACTSFMDAQAGRVLDELDRLKLTDNTIVVFLGDHGYSLGEHAAWQKMMLFEPVARIPLLLAAPGVKPTSTNSLVEAIDIAPTVAEIAGVQFPAPRDGKSLNPLLKDPTQPFKKAAYTQLSRRDSSGRAVRSDRWRYIEWDVADGIEAELYDEHSDPGELTNLAHDPAHAQAVADMKSLLHEVLPPGSAKRPQR